MGQVARELGYLGEDLWDLTEDVMANINVGCRKLYKLAKRAGITHSQWSDNELYVVSLGYNGGGNVKYPAEVIQRIKDGSAKGYLEKGYA
jgi:hypothetical protein